MQIFKTPLEHQQIAPHGRAKIYSAKNIVTCGIRTSISNDHCQTLLATCKKKLSPYTDDSFVCSEIFVTQDIHERLFAGRF